MYAAGRVTGSNREQWLAAVGQTWPELIDRLGGALVLEWLATRVAIDEVVPTSFAGDLALALGCLQQHPIAIALLDEKLLSKLGAFVGRVDGSPSFIDELRQSLREHLLVGAAPRIGAYEGRGSLEGWLRITATRMALRLKQRQPVIAEPRDQAAASGAGADPETAFLKHRYRAELATALEAAVVALPKEERTWLKLYYLDELTIEQIGALYRVHASTVSRRLRALEGKLLKDLRAEIRQRLRVPSSEIDSLIDLCKSQLDLNLSGVLRQSPAG